MAEMMDSVGEDKPAAPWWAHVALTLEPDLPLVLPRRRQTPQRHTGGHQLCRPRPLEAPPSSCRKPHCLPTWPSYSPVLIPHDCMYLCYYISKEHLTIFLLMLFLMLISHLPFLFLQPVRLPDLSHVQRLLKDWFGTKHGVWRAQRRSPPDPSRRTT